MEIFQPEVEESISRGDINMSRRIIAAIPLVVCLAAILFSSSTKVIAGTALDDEASLQIQGGCNALCARPRGDKCYGSGACIAESNCRPNRCTVYDEHEECASGDPGESCDVSTDPSGCGESYTGETYCTFPAFHNHCAGGTKTGNCGRQVATGNPC